MPEKDRFFIAIIPEGELEEDLLMLKEEVHEKFNSKAALRSPPHITLHMPFNWRVDREQELLDSLSKFRFLASSFSVSLKDFGFFPPRVVYVGVMENELLRQLFQELARYAILDLKLFNADYKSRGFHPHLTIGFRDLKKAIFHEVETYYGQKSFEDNFEVKGFWLLKHDGQRWHKHRFFELGG